MKKYAMLVLASVFMFSMVVMAQEQTPNQVNKREFRQGDRQRLTPEMRTERLTKDVTLSDEQKVKVQAMYQKQDSIFTKFRAEVSRDNPDFREKMKAMRDAQDAELESIIGTEKFQKQKQLRADRQQKMRETR